VWWWRYVLSPFPGFGLWMRVTTGILESTRRILVFLSHTRAHTGSGNGICGGGFGVEERIIITEEIILPLIENA